jgi:hypothetical protein
MLRLGFWLGLMAATVGCGGGGPAGDTLSGTTGGGAFVIKDAVIATTATWTSSPDPGDSTVIILSDREGLCADIQAGRSHAGSRFLIMYLAAVGAGTMSPITSAGAYPIGPNDAVVPPVSGFAFYSALDAQCAGTAQLAFSGTVTLTDLGAGATSASGRLAIMFEDGSTLGGNFSATSGCPPAAVDAYLSAMPTCS